MISLRPRVREWRSPGWAGDSVVKMVRGNAGDLMVGVSGELWTPAPSERWADDSVAATAYCTPRDLTVGVSGELWTPAPSAEAHRRLVRSISEHGSIGTKGQAGDASAEPVTRATSDLAFCVTDAILLLAMTWRDRVTQVTQRRKIAGLSPAAALVYSFDPAHPSLLCGGSRVAKCDYSVMRATRASSRCPLRDQLNWQCTRTCRARSGSSPMRLVLSGPRRSGHFL
jgi:hypothetical protein